MNNHMTHDDRCCTLVPYFDVPEENLADFKTLCEEFVERTRSEAGCLHYGFSFDGNQAHCREGYRDAQSLLAHLDNIGAILERALNIATISRLEVHAPASELAKLRAPLADLNPRFFVLEYGFRK